MRTSALVFSLFYLLPVAVAFLSPAPSKLRCHVPLCDNVDVNAETDTEQELRSSVASKFKVLTCTSTACAKRRKQLGLDELATFGAFFSRAKDEMPEIEVEESPCLGSCKEGPCVAVEHDDYYGQVALEGMKPGEFSKSCFHNVITEEDADRVWSCVKNAVDLMMEEEE